MRPSSPGKVLTTRPRFHLPRGKLSSTTSTRSPIWASVWDLVLHFLRSVSVGMYSRNHLLQKSVWACLHRFLEFKSLSSKTSGGTFELFFPMRKWLGVIASGSWGSMLTWVSGRLLSRLSISAINVSKVSSFTSWPFRVIFRTFFADLTSPSQTPPKWGAEGGLKNHWILSRYRVSEILALSIPSRHSLSSCSAPNKIGSVVAVDVSRFSSSSHHSSQRHDKAVCLEWVCNL